MNAYIEEGKAWAESLYQKLDAKISAEVERNGDNIPYVSRDGRYDDKSSHEDIHWWTNGFWPGICWQMYHLTGDERYADAARGVESKLDEAFDEFVRIHHDVGFMWLPSAVANWRITGNQKSHDRGMHAATILAGRYNPAGHFIRAWNKGKTGWVIIDSMMNIPLLYWASEQIDDPRFSYIAQQHADTVARTLVRGDGSCGHIAIFDPLNGDLLDMPAGQGYEAGSSWSRGAAWAIYGFALSYRYTGRQEYLDTAKKVAHYFMSEIARTGDVALLDFRAPAEPQIWDSSAGCCAACGFIEIAKHVGELEREHYLEWAIRILWATDERFCDWNPQTDGLVQMGTVAYDDLGCRHTPLIFNDYYFIEALLKLNDREIHLW
ncbi:glycoside hydrolase family 88 protein [uncultured Parolsenella sp.]|uniref:glycoside hydrolase family 88 protein n=1 Tax=uncultured Parolsenella sp. TaxID=2083008 RepID=UPI0025F0CAF7|nr:glycoside hydrolase family 88 protein [uncultured Parolsenella sp.]